MPDAVERTQLIGALGSRSAHPWHAACGSEVHGDTSQPHERAREGGAARWSEIVALLDLLTPDERLVPGYFRDLVAHLGAWLTEAATQLTYIAAQTYEVRDLDVDARNAEPSRRCAKSPGKGYGGMPLLHAPTCCNIGSRCEFGAIPRIYGYGRLERNTMVSICHDFGRGSPSWSTSGRARRAMSGTRRSWRAPASDQP